MFAHGCMYVQWSPSNPDTSGPEESVLIREVSLFQGLTNMVLGEEECVLFREVSLFRGVFREGLHCICILMLQPSCDLYREMMQYSTEIRARCCEAGIKRNICDKLNSVSTRLSLQATLVLLFSLLLIPLCSPLTRDSSVSVEYPRVKRLTSLNSKSAPHPHSSPLTPSNFSSLEPACCPGTHVLWMCSILVYSVANITAKAQCSFVLHKVSTQ